MQYDRIKMNRLAKEEGFVRDTLEKVLRIADILHFMQQSELLSSRLALKGGTAINLTVASHPRLSVDIDMDFVGDMSRKQMIEQRSVIIDQISKYMESNGYAESHKTKRYHALDSFVYDYQNAGNIKDNVKIEINYMLRNHILDIDHRRCLVQWGKQDQTITTVNLIEIYASKIVALINRNAPRDLYDVYNMIRNDIIPESEHELLRKCIVFYSAIGSDCAPLDFNVDEIANADLRKVRTDLFPVLRHDERFDALSAESEVKSFLSKLLNLTKQEKLFLQYFAIKEYRPELLFENPVILERVSRHPMAMWKCSTREKKDRFREQEL